MTATVEGKISKPLKKLLKRLVDPDVQEQLLVADSALGKAIKVRLVTLTATSTAVRFRLGEIQLRLRLQQFRSGSHACDSFASGQSHSDRREGTRSYAHWSST